MKSFQKRECYGVALKSVDPLILVQPPEVRSLSTKKEVTENFIKQAFTGAVRTAVLETKSQSEEDKEGQGYKGWSSGVQL